MDSRYSLKKNSDFRRLYSKGKSAAGPYAVVYCRRNREGVNRVGFTVSAKLGHAVVRNRIRRQLREIYRLNSSSLKQGYDVIIVARGRCVGAEYGRIESSVLDAFSRLSLLEAKQ